jgi:Domain of unknown function (DUF4328)
LETLKPNKKRAEMAIILIWIVLGFESIILISSYLRFETLLKKQNSDTIGTFSNSDYFDSIIGVASLIAYLISSITFIRWFRRAYFNLHLLVVGLKYSEGWAAGAWFTPIINWIRPFQIMKELFLKTKLLLAEKSLSQNINLKSQYLAWWWAIWILNTALLYLILTFSTNNNTTSESLLVNSFTFSSNIIGILLALITNKIIKDYSLAEDELFENHDSYNDEINSIGIKLLP